MAIIAFALILAFQGILGLVDKLKGKEQANQAAPSTLIPLQPALGRDLSQDLTRQDIERIIFPLLDGAFSGLQEQLEQGLSSEDLQRALKQAEALSCAFQGGNWDLVNEICN